MLILTVILLFASAIQQQTGLFKCKELNGVDYERPKPELSFATFCDGSYQKQTENYLQYHYGFREPLTRLYNQTVWSLYRYSSVEEKKRIMIAKDNWLFEPWTVEEYYESCAYKIADDSLSAAKIFNAEAKRLYQIQRILEPYGTHLFVALWPGKELVCSDHMPANKQFFNKKQLTALEHYSKRFGELGVNHVNFGEWFVQLKDTVSFPLFPQTGTHWSNLAAIHVADSLVNYLEALGDVNMHNVEIGPIFQRTLKPDADLESLMNLIWPLKKRPNMLAQATCDRDSTALKPTLITIGDSFYWNILNFVPILQIFEKVPYWYYFSSAIYDPPETNVADKDIVKEMIEADFIMLAYGTTQLYKMSNGFSIRALLELCYDDDEIASGKALARKDFESDSAMVAKAKMRAEEENDPLDVAMDDEFDEWINTHLEDYFPDLRDSVPLRRSLRARCHAGDSLAFVEWEIQKEMKKIRGNEKLMEQVREKARNRGYDEATMVRLDARWVVKRKITEGILVFQDKPKKRLTTNLDSEIETRGESAEIW